MHSSALKKFSKTPLTTPTPTPTPQLQPTLHYEGKHSQKKIIRLLGKKKNKNNNQIKMHYQIIALCKFSACQVLKCELQSGWGSLPWCRLQRLNWISLNKPDSVWWRLALFNPVSPQSQSSQRLSVFAHRMAEHVYVCVWRSFENQSNIVNIF